MRNFIAVVFNDSSKAYEALHDLWHLDSMMDITVHGAAVVHRDDLGRFQVDTKDTHPVLATGAGVAIGALLGAILGPLGATAGAAAGAAAAGGAAIGAAAGGVAGLGVDANRADTHDEAARETGLVLSAGQSAVIADVSEEWTTPIDTKMRGLGGIVYRRARSAVEDDSWYDSYLYPYDYYLYPYEYVPPRYPY